MRLNFCNRSNFCPVLRGNAHVLLGKYRRAIEFYEQSLEIARVIEDRNGQADSLFNCALALAKVDDYWTARQKLELALEIYDELQLPHRIKQCSTRIRELGQIISAQPGRAPAIGTPEPTKSKEDWCQKSLPTNKTPKASSAIGNQWLFSVIIVVVVVVLIVVFQ